MAVRSKRLFGPTSVAASQVLVYTCPAGETAILKQLTVHNPGALPQVFTMRLNGSNAANTILAESIEAGLATHLEGLFIVLSGGGTLHVAGAAVGLFVAGFGAELEGIAD